MLRHQQVLLAENISLQGLAGVLPAGHHRMAQSGDGAWVGRLLRHLTQVRSSIKMLEATVSPNCSSNSACTLKTLRLVSDFVQGLFE